MTMHTTDTPADLWRGARRRLHLQEVGPRDGLQMEAAFVPTADKIALVDALSEAGLAKIEATAFVSPQAIPALRDAEIVLREIRRAPGVVYTCLVPNRRGAERAIEARADELNLVMSASETHNLANLRMTRAQSFAALSGVIDMAREAAVPVNVSLSCVFGCPMEGDVAPAVVLDCRASAIDAPLRSRLARTRLFSGAAAGSPSRLPFLSVRPLRRRLRSSLRGGLRPGIRSALPHKRGSPARAAARTARQS